MTDSFEKKLRDSEIRWNFINIPRKYIHLFPKGRSIKVNCEGRTFQVSVNKANRIVSKKLFQEIKPRPSGIMIITKKSDDEFYITLK